MESETVENSYQKLTYQYRFLGSDTYLSSIHHSVKKSKNIFLVVKCLQIEATDGDHKALINGAPSWPR